MTRRSMSRKERRDPRRVVGYVRVSTEDQNLGPEAQKESLDRWCKQNIASLVAVHQDIGISGGAPLDRRPGLIAALDALRDEEAGVLLVAKRDRLARDHVAAGMIDSLVERAISPTEPISAQVLPGHETIFLVEDEEVVRVASQRMLEALGYQVLEAEEGERALALFQEFGSRIDLVILDLIMSGMGGEKVFEGLRSLDSSIKILLASGCSAEGKAQALLGLEGVEFIQKPFTHQALSQKLRSIFSQKTAAP